MRTPTTRRRHQFGLAILALSLLAMMFQNCSMADAIKNGSTEQLSEDLSAAKPIVDCQVRKSNGTFVRRIHSLSPTETFGGEMVAEGETVNIDCSPTQTGDGAESTFSFVLTDISESNPAAPETKADGYFQKTFTVADRRKFKLEVTDARGYITEKTFELPVRCAAASAPPVIDGSAITVTPLPAAGDVNTPIPNSGFYKFSAAGAVSGGKPYLTGGSAYYYAWDFDGDDSLDMQPYYSNGLKWTSWRQSDVADKVYSLFTGNRDLTLYVMDSCQNMASVKVNRAITVTKPLRVPAATPAVQSKDVYYLQGDLRRLTGADSQLKTAEFTAHAPANPPDGRRHVACSYSRNKDNNIASLTVASMNHYASESYDRLRQGLGLVFDQISDNNAKGGNINNNTGNITFAEYKVAEQGDLSMTTFYKSSSGNKQRLRIDRIETDSTCENNPSQKKTTLLIYGDFDIPSLTATEGSLAVDNGKFYCEISELDQCPGAGGMDPGQPPPAQ